MAPLPAGYTLAPFRIVNVLTSAVEARFALAGPGSQRPGHVHAGADFSGVRGEPVLAMADGRVRGVWVQQAAERKDVSPPVGGVVRARTFGALPRGPGLYVEIVHAMAAGAPQHTVYMHLETAEVRAGQLVLAGQTLGSMGASGVDSGAVHLHFEVYEGPADARGDQRDCLNPLGFQRYTTKRAWGGIKTDRPGDGVWEVTHVYRVRCFPRSRTPRGKVGIDKPLPIVSDYYRWANGAAVVGLGGQWPYLWEGRPVSFARDAGAVLATQTALPAELWAR